MEVFDMHESNQNKYVRLIMQRDQVQKEARICNEEYLREFGEEILQVFEEKIKCIELRKKIHHCQARVNHHEHVEEDVMEKMVYLEMKEYYDKMKNLQSILKNVKEKKESTAYQAMEAKRLYRKLAKMIHPDICPRTATDTLLKESWGRAVLAYHRNAVDELQEIEVVVVHRLKELDIPVEAEPEVEDIQLKIERLESQISRIINTDPYQYHELFARRELVQERHEEILDELNQYRNHHEELEKILNMFLSEGDVTILWKMD